MPEDLTMGTAPPATPASPFVELGITGLRRTGGYLDEEFLPQLRGRKAVQVFREMSENDPIVGALLFSFDRLLRQVEWRVEPGDSSDDQRQAAEFLESCKDDMSHTWDEFLTEVLSMMVFGWSWHEIVYKKRVGPWEEDAKKRSRHTDGMIGWRKLPIRAQETLHHWQFDDTSGVQGMWQMAPPDYKTRYLPVQRSLLFRPITAKNNPEGRSLLRNAYRPWFFKKRIEEFEAIGVERDLAGMPVAKLPLEYITATSGQEKAVADATRKVIRGIRRDEHEGVLWPREIDRETKQDMFELELLGGGGTRQFNTHQIIDRYSTEILQSVLADFIKLGHQGVGSYSMHTDKTGLFRASVNTISQAIADVLNQHAVPRLFQVNNLKLDTLPKFVPNNVDPPDLGQLSQFIQALTSAGMTFFPDPDMEQFVRSAAQLPDLDENELRMREAEARFDSIMRLGQKRLELISTSAQAAGAAQQMAAGGPSGLPGQVNSPPGGGPNGTPSQQSGPPGLPGPGPSTQPALPPGPVRKRLSDKHGKRWRRLKKHPATQASGEILTEVGEAMPPQSTLGAAVRAKKTLEEGGLL